MTTPTLPPLPVILPPLPAIEQCTDWIDIDGPDYARPEPGRDGYYELLPIDGGPVERKWFSSGTGNWMCVGGRVIWTIYKAWRGSSVPFAFPEPAPLPPLPSGIEGVERKWLQLPLVTPMATLDERDSMARAAPIVELPGLGDGVEYFDPATGNTWSNRGRPPAWFKALEPGEQVALRIKRIKRHYYNVATGEQVAYVRGAA